MLENIVLALFAIAILLCVASGQSVVIALAFGLALFLWHGHRLGFGAGELARMCLAGLGKTRVILFTYILIGLLTATWRASGTIPEIVALASGLVSAQGFLLTAFLLNCALSFLTGTSFGTAATMGVITMSTGLALGQDPAWLGGAILSGAYFGDRCSPVSTSALLVATLTRTDIYRNVRLMIWSGTPAFLLACAIFFAMSFTASPTSGGAAEAGAIFSRILKLHWVDAMPAVAVLALALARVPVTWTLGAGIALASGIALLFQGMPVSDFLAACFYGFHTTDPKAAALLNGGGIRSMEGVACIIVISSCYAGIFQRTGLLSGLQTAASAIARRIGGFPAICLGATATSALACSQTLGIILTHQLFEKEVPEKEELMIGLENSASVIPALLPWCVAGAVPVAAIGAPAAAFAAAAYLWLVPLCAVAESLWRRRGTRRRG